MSLYLFHEQVQSMYEAFPYPSNIIADQELCKIALELQKRTIVHILNAKL